MKQEHILTPGPDISFSEIKSLFDYSVWDVGYLNDVGFQRASAAPVKHTFHLYGYDAVSDIHKSFLNGIVLVRYTEVANDYSLYKEAEKILEKKFDKSNFVFTYTNYKESAILSGMGIRAKNSLIYNRKFGFQSKICSFMFSSNITNVPNIKPNRGILDLCEGCEDCIKNCPVGAIHEEWIDAAKCDNHIGEGIKWFWYDKMQPNIPREVVETWNTWENMPRLEWGQGVDGFYKLDGHQLTRDGKPISMTHCRECVLQPRCSKAPCFSQ